MRDAAWFAGIVSASIIMGPVYLALAVWDRLASIRPRITRSIPSGD